MISRSLHEPGSDSSALTHRKLGRPGVGPLRQSAQSPQSVRPGDAGHALPDFTLQEGVDQERDKVEEQHRLDPADVLEPHRRQVLHRLELLVPLLEPRLELVGLQGLPERQGRLVTALAGAACQH